MAKPRFGLALGHAFTGTVHQPVVFTLRRELMAIAQCVAIRSLLAIAQIAHHLWARVVAVISARSRQAIADA